MDNKAIIIYPQEFHKPVVFEFPFDELTYKSWTSPQFNKKYSTLEQLEFIFRQCNHVDGSEWIQNKELRSLSVGDMVVLNGQVWVCCDVGWKEMEKLIK